MARVQQLNTIVKLIGHILFEVNGFHNLQVILIALGTCLLIPTWVKARAEETTWSPLPTCSSISLMVNNILHTAHFS